MPASWTNATKNTSSWSNTGKNGIENSYLLLEDDSFMLLEDGDKILLTEVIAWSNQSKS